MATNGNSSTTNQQLEKVAEAAIAAGATVQDLISRDEATNQLMDVIAGELGDVGEQDAREIRAFSAHRRTELKQFVTKLITRKRRELPDLERILEDRGMNFDGLKRNKYGAILADPPWAFNLWWNGRSNKTPAGVPSRATEPHYQVIREPELNALPVGEVVADDCVLFLWTCWPVLAWSLRTIEAWGFEYKTCGFCWVKAHAQQLEMFQDDIEPHMTLGYWTRSNSEICLLATRGNPKRIGTDVRQAIIAPRREHSRKPDGIHERIERLVAGPYLELFARQRRPGWDCWGNEVDKFAPQQAAPAQSESWAEMWAKPFDFSQEPTP